MSSVAKRIATSIWSRFRSTTSLVATTRRSTSGCSFANRGSRGTSQVEASATVVVTDSVRQGPPARWVALSISVSAWSIAR